MVTVTVTNCLAVLNHVNVSSELLKKHANITSSQAVGELSFRMRILLKNRIEKGRSFSYVSFEAGF